MQSFLNFFTLKNIVGLIPELAGAFVTIFGPPFYRGVRKKMKNITAKIDYCIDLNFLFVGLFLLPIYLVKIGIHEFFRNSILSGVIITLVSATLFSLNPFIGPFIIEKTNHKDWGKPVRKILFFTFSYGTARNTKFARIGIGILILIISVFGAYIEIL